MYITYERMDYFVKRAVMLSRNIAICPMGECGLLSKKILNWRYGIEECYRIDNNMKTFNSSIIGLEELEKSDIENLVIILATVKKGINNELMDQIHMLKKDITVVNVLDPMVIEKEDFLEYIKKMRELLTVRGVVGGKGLIRVGREHDGGYVMLNDFTNNMCAYSFGIADDVSWEEQILENEINVYMYDHTIENLPKQLKGGIFYKIGISGKDDLDNNVLSMDTILEKNNDTRNAQLLLKMDVEGAEWDFLEKISTDVLKNFVQMTFEFHSLLDSKNQERILDILSKINKTHQIVWVHANNSGLVYAANGLMLPNLLEVTYVNRAKYEFYDYDVYNVPMELDMPNLSDRNEIMLGDFSGSLYTKNI